MELAVFSPREEDLAAGGAHVLDRGHVHVAGLSPWHEVKSGGIRLIGGDVKCEDPAGSALAELHDGAGGKEDRLAAVDVGHGQRAALFAHDTGPGLCAVSAIEEDVIDGLAAV